MTFSKVIGKALQGSFPGTPSRSGDQLIQARTAAEIIKFGDPLKFDAANNQWKNIEAGDSASDIVGFAVRAIKQALTYQTQADEYPANSDVDALTRGFIAVTVAAGTPTLGGQVYVINAVGTSGLAIGDIITTAFLGPQVETAVCTTGAVTAAGTITVTVTAAGMTGSPKAVALEVEQDDTVDEVAGKVRVALAADVNVGAFFTVSGTGANVILSTVTPAATDATLAIAVVDTDTTGVVFSASTDTSESGTSVAVPNTIFTTLKNSVSGTAEIHKLVTAI